jgi:hypothetical protein
MVAASSTLTELQPAPYTQLPPIDTLGTVGYGLLRPSSFSNIHPEFLLFKGSQSEFQYIVYNDFRYPGKRNFSSRYAWRLQVHFRLKDISLRSRTNVSVALSIAIRKRKTLVHHSIPFSRPSRTNRTLRVEVQVDKRRSFWDRRQTVNFTSNIFVLSQYL